MYAILRLIAEQLDLMECRIMSAFDDVKAAAARVAASSSAEIQAVSAKIDSLTASTITDADLAALSASLNETSDALDAEAAKLAAVPPDPAT